MPLKKIITVPSETLRKISEPLENVGKEEKKLIKDLFETMYHNKGIGLAAIQVGIPKRIIVLDVSKDCLLYTSPSPRDTVTSRMPSSA